jgi:hypothetical protein
MPKNGIGSTCVASSVRSEWVMPCPATIQFTAPGSIHCIGAEAVAMVHPAAIEIADRGQPDMGMRAHVHALGGQEFGRAHLVEEDETADHLPPWGGQGAAHLETAEIAGARNDDRLDAVHGVAVGAIGVEGGVPGHGHVSSGMGGWSRNRGKRAAG